MLKPTVGQFPSIAERDRLTTLGKFRRLYEGEQYAVLGLHDIIKKQYEKEKDIVYLSNPIPARVADFYGDFVAGDTEKMTIEAGTDENGDSNSEADEFVNEVVYENDLKEKVADIANGQSEFGFCPLLGWLDENDIYHIDIIPQDQYFPQPDGSIIIATYRKDPNANEMSKELLLLTKHYFMEGEDCVIERAAWKCDERGVIKESYNLELMGEIMGRQLLPLTRLNGLGDIPIRQVDNTHRNAEGFGKSDFYDIIAPLAEINERSTQMATQFLKNMDAKMQLPASLFNEDGKLAAFEAIAIDKDSPEAKYITNDNPLMADAREHITSQLKMISYATAVPMFELLKSAMPERVESLRIQMFQAIRRANRKRSKIKRALNDMFRLGMKMKSIEFDNDIDIDFSDVLPVDDYILAETESTKINAGLSSKRSAIMRLEGCDEEEADEEMRQIAMESKIAGVGGEPPKIEDMKVTE